MKFYFLINRTITDFIVYIWLYDSFSTMHIPLSTKNNKTLNHEHQWCLRPAPMVFMLRTYGVHAPHHMCAA